MADATDELTHADLEDLNCDRADVTLRQLAKQIGCEAGRLRAAAVSSRRKPRDLTCVSSWWGAPVKVESID